MLPTFTVLIGSIGRPSLKHTLDSIKRQAREPGDQVIVSFDAFEQSPEDIANRIQFVHSYGEGFIGCAYDSGYHWLGVEQINYAMQTVPITGSHVFTVGDDDVFVDASYSTLRYFCSLDPLRPILYRFVTPAAIGRQLLWDRPRMAPCLISGCCIAAPREFVDLMHTRIETTHDYDWMVEILKKAKLEHRDPLWLDYVGVIARPDPRGISDVKHQGVWQCWNCRRWGYREDVPVTITQCACGVPFDHFSYRPRVVEECAI